MKKAILFPPHWSPAMPYLSLPCLTAYLNEQNININQFDLNLDEFKYFLSKEFLDECLMIILKKDMSKENHELYTMIHNYLLSNIKKFHSFINNKKEFLNIKNYKYMKIFLEEIHNYISVAYNPFEITFDHIKFGENLSINNIDNLIKNSTINPYINFSNKMIEEKKLYEFDFVAISIVIPMQIIPALTICNLLKLKNPDIHITIGGSAFSKIYYKIDKFKDLFKYFDSILLFEGEYTLSKLIINLENKSGLRNVPNCVYKCGKEIVFNEIHKQNIKIENLMSPNFNGFNLKSYISPSIILPYFISRSCYWGKCAFCDHDFGHDGIYRLKSVEKVIQDLKYMKEKYYVEYIYFIDEAIHPKYMDKLCDAFIKEKLNLKWFTCIKASSEFTQELCLKMKDAGCVLVYVGIESCSTKVLRDMNKGINLEDIKVVVKNMDKCGIWLHAFLINDFPTENFEDKLETLLFIENNSIHSIGLSEFSLSKNSKIVINNLEFNLKNLQENKDFSSKLDFEVDGIAKKETYSSLINIYSKRIYNKLFPNIIFLREHLPIFLSEYNLINKKYILKSLVRDDEVYSKKYLLYKKINKDSLIIYNLKNKGAFVTSIEVIDILNECDNIDSVQEMIDLIKLKFQEEESFNEMVEIIDTIFQYNIY